MSYNKFFMLKNKTRKQKFPIALKLLKAKRQEFYDAYQYHVNHVCRSEIFIERKNRIMAYWKCQISRIEKEIKSLSEAK